jgi:hypothetical protein
MGASNMLKHCVTGLFACVSLLGAGAANATILTFDTPLGDLAPIADAYGDRVNATTDPVGSYLQGKGFTPNVFTTYRTVNPANNTTFQNYISYKPSGYGDLKSVATTAVDGYLAEVSLIPEQGWGVLLNGFDLAGLGEDISQQTLRLLDGNNNSLAIYPPIKVVGRGRSSHLLDIRSNTGIRIQFGPSQKIAIDNIKFEQFALTPPYPPAVDPDNNPADKPGSGPGPKPSPSQPSPSQPSPSQPVPSSVPEPSSVFSLLALGAIAAGAQLLRKNHKQA